MKDIQDHIRNEGLLNLFDGRSHARAARHIWSDYGEKCVQCGLTRQDAFDAGVPYSCSKVFKGTAQDRNVFRPDGEADAPET